MVKSAGWAQVQELAEQQWGLVTTRQVEAIGVAWTTLSRQATHGGLERVARGVYRIRGVAETEDLQLKAAWLQLAPTVAVWDRQPTEGVVSHRSAAAVLGLGPLPADLHEFTLPTRRRSRRPDVRLHRGNLTPEDWLPARGLLVTSPRRLVADLLSEREDPEAVGQIFADSLRAGLDTASAVAEKIAPYSAALGARRGDGRALAWRLLDLTDMRDDPIWEANLMEELGDPDRRGAGA